MFFLYSTIAFYQKHRGDDIWQAIIAYGNKMKKKNLDSYRTWNVDIGIDHPLSKINVYNVLSPQDCQRIIAEGENVARKIGGWMSTRHKGAPTTDLPFHFLGGPKRKIFGRWQTYFEKKILNPIFQKDYAANFISFNDLFLVKYSAHNQSDLILHRDGTVLSFVLQLNEDFEDGGTYIHSLGESLVHSTGDLCVHSGWLLHGANAISAGTRYVLIGFCNIQALWLNAEVKKPYYQYTEDKTVLRSAIRKEFF